MHHAVSVCYRDLDVGSFMSRARTSLRYKNGRIYFIGFNHLLVLMLVTEVANVSIRVDINCIDPKYFSSGVFLL